jgi:thiol-disulfide isomerase/thioredoxin
MKFLFITLLFGAILLFSSSNSDDLVRIPIKLVDGYANLNPGFGALGGQLSSDHPWYRIENQTLPGIPAHWADVVKRTVWFDAKQFAFQNYKQGSLDETYFKELKESWDIDLAKRLYSEKPIKCFVHVVYGKDQEGNIRYKVDSNNNLDFNDDPEFTPMPYNWTNTDLLVQNAHRVKYEVFRQDKVIELTAPLSIVQIKGSLWRNFAQHAEADFNGEKLIISSQGFGSTDYDPASINIFTKHKTDEIVNENEFILINGTTYKNLGVNSNQQLLTLRKMPNDTVIYSSQIGFNAKPFAGRDFSSNEKISLEQFRGKFLYLEFWGSWCGPCIQELPNLKGAYAQLNRTQIDFIGIAFDEAEPLKKILTKEEIKWKQILLEREDGIISDYNIRSYPTSFLIDPNGKIVAKNLRGEGLADTLRYFLKNQK